MSAPCDDCAGVGFRETPKGSVVWPCATCNPDAYERWSNGDYQPTSRTTGGNEPTEPRKVSQ